MKHCFVARVVPCDTIPIRIRRNKINTSGSKISTLRAILFENMLMPMLFYGGGDDFILHPREPSSVCCSSMAEVVARNCAGRPPSTFLSSSFHPSPYLHGKSCLEEGN